MTIKTIEPFVRFARKINHFIPALVIAPDHRLFYCTAGWANLEVGAQRIHLSHGDLLFVPAGTPYRATMLGEGFDTITLNFDFSQENACISTAVPPLYEDKLIDFAPLESEAPPDEFRTTLLVREFGEGERYMRDIEHEYRHKKLYAEKRTSLLLSSLLILTLRRATAFATPRFSTLAEQVAAYLRNHYREPCTNKTIGEIFSYHPNYLNRLMVAYTGLSLHKYLTRTRIDRAIDLLSTTTLSVSEVGAAVGFPDPSHFSKAFEKTTGYLPSAFRA